MVVRQLTHGQGRLAMEDGDYRRARSLFEESLALGLGREKEIGPETLRRMGELSYLENKYPEARTELEEALRLSREIGNMQLVSEALHARGKVLIAEGDVAGGRTLLEESLGINREIAITAGFTMIESAVHNGIPKKGSTGSNRAPRWSPWGDSGGIGQGICNPL